VGVLGVRSCGPQTTGGVVLLVHYIIHFRFHIRRISIHKLLYFSFFSTSFCTTFLYAGLLLLIIIIIIIIIHFRCARFRYTRRLSGSHRPRVRSACIDDPFTVDDVRFLPPSKAYQTAVRTQRKPGKADHILRFQLQMMMGG